IPYLLMRRSPRRWWLYIWMASTAATVFMVCITPIWIDPLFNKFSPMKDKVLETDILALAERAGIESSRVYEVEKSADTKAVNPSVFQPRQPRARSSHPGVLAPSRTRSRPVRSGNHARQPRRRHRFRETSNTKSQCASAGSDV